MAQTHTENDIDCDHSEEQELCYWISDGKGKGTSGRQERKKHLLQRPDLVESQEHLEEEEEED